MSHGDLSGLGLEAWLCQHVQGFEGPFELEKFPTGQSNPTYRLTARSGQYVLRRRPFGRLLPSAHAVDREYRILWSLWPLGLPAPRPLAICCDAEVIGSEFYLMELVEGRSYTDGALPGLSPAERTQIYFNMADALARLHVIDPEAVGLGDFGKSGNYFSRQVARWTRQYRDSQTDEVLEMEHLIDWLPNSLPDQGHSRIVHGDYRLDNVIFTDDQNVAAILDWELATLGDPLADFSYFALQWVLPANGEAALGGLNLGALGIPTLDQISERYCRSVGIPALPDLDWYFAYNLFRLAGIVQGVKKRLLTGNASHPRACDVAARVPLFASAAWEFARSAKLRTAERWNHSSQGNNRRRNARRRDLVGGK